jgi:molecular chaperone DnaK
MASENKSIGRFILDGILPAPRGVPQIEVTFDINADGILSVSARDKATGREQKITIQPSSGLTKEEIERMIREAELHAEEDRRRREEIELRNQADSLAYQAEKTLRENSERIPSDLKLEVEGKIAAVRSALQSGTVSTIRSAVDDLSQAMQRVGQAVYSAAGARPGGPSEEPGPRPTEEGTVEGEFREV